LAIGCLYLYGLSSVGVLDPDEPRYLAIGRAMAHTGDFVTPRLWGDAWFEKPPLLYWLTSIGTALDLGPELAGRLPVALLSLSFLAAMFAMLRIEFGVEAAATASVLLATSVEWLADSNLALTDLPLAVFFSLAVLAALPLVKERPADERQSQAVRFLLIGLFLGLATLAKGLVPIALALPFCWFLRQWWRSWWVTVFALFATALPWYVAVYARNGRPFLEEFFWKHHFERVYSASLLHAQPWWYYVPVFPGALFPWTPLFGLLLFSRNWWNVRRRFLAACVLFGLVLFSVSLNKLPGYVLPLIPSAFALLASAFDWPRFNRHFRLWLLPSAILIGLLPLVARLLPETLAIGRLTLVRGLHFGPTDIFYMGAPIAAVLLARRAWAGILLVLCFVAGGLFVKIVAFPVLDRTVSPRGPWQQLQHVKGSVCNDWLGRKWEYGLALYRGEPYPVCGTGVYDFALQSHGRDLPILVPKKKP